MEKLLTMKEVSDILGISEEELEGLVKEGKIPAYRIGGLYLRFKKDQINRLKYNFLKNKQAKDISPALKGNQDYNYTATDRIKDFFYFNDFYVLSFILIITLLWFILY